MGDLVVGVKFGGTAAERMIMRWTEIPEGEERLGSSRELLLADFLYDRANRNRMTEAGRIADMMSDVIFQLPEFRLPSADYSQKELLRRISLERLCAFLIEESRGKEWKSQPAYYSALLLAFSERCDLLMRIREDLKRRLHPEE